jgi:hypothetical protein
MVTLDIRGGIGFIACQPGTELEELSQRGVCSADLPTILREMAHVESVRRKGVLDTAAFEKQMVRLKRVAAQPGKSMRCITKTEKTAFQ